MALLYTPRLAFTSYTPLLNLDIRNEFKNSPILSSPLYFLKLTILSHVEMHGHHIFGMAPGQR